MVNAQLYGFLRHLQGLHDLQPLTEVPDADLLAWFNREHEEAAFTALVRRHGPVVWSVARRVLGRHDAEDVFQATFLLLARKAASIHKSESLGSWLHGVAHRLALKVRLQQTRRQSRERRSATMRQSGSSGETSLSEIQVILDTALGDLPEKYRTALVLCYLQGKTQEEAARSLGCPLATVRTRVARGRKLLRERLANHGLTLSTTGLATLLIASAAPAVAPAALVKATVEAALPFAAGQPVTALCSRQAASLVEGGLQTMCLTRWKTMTVLLLLAASLVAGATALTHRVTAGAEAKPAVARRTKPRPPEVQPAAKDEKDSITYRGQVLGPDGRPVRGAKLSLTEAWGYHYRSLVTKHATTTGADGRFEFTIPRATFGDRATTITASAANLGVGWKTIAPDSARDNLTLHLVNDDVPITGQIIDLEGKPVQGATLRVLQINAAPGEDLGPWLEAARGKKGLSLQLEQKYLPRFTTAISTTVTTDARGRFRLTGIGRNRLVLARLDGPTVASQLLHLLTRPGGTITVTENKAEPAFGDPGTATTYHGADFKHAVAPTRPIIGAVRDLATNQPLAGLTIQSYARAITPGSWRILEPVVQATTDAEGHYRLTGLGTGAGYQIAAVPGNDQPYVVTSKEVPNRPGLEPVTVDFALKRGVWIEGKITDKVTGQPVQTTVEYFSLSSNPNLPDYPGFDGTILRLGGVGIKADGSYRLVGLPGPGVVAVYHRDHYLRAPARKDEFGIKEPSLSTAPYALLFPINYSALARINPPRGARLVKQDVTLDPGWTCTGTVLGPDGKPFVGAWSFGLNGNGWSRKAMKTAEFTIRGFDPHQPRPVFFQHLEKELVGVAQSPKRNGDSITVRMMPGATVTGRLVDADGQPRGGVILNLSFRTRERSAWSAYFPKGTLTDREGRFRLRSLVPGHEYRLSGDKGELRLPGPLRSGQKTDLGDVRLKAKEG